MSRLLQLFSWIARKNGKCPQAPITESKNVRGLEEVVINKLVDYGCTLLEAEELIACLPDNDKASVFLTIDNSDDPEAIKGIVDTILGDDPVKSEEEKYFDAQEEQIGSVEWILKDDPVKSEEEKYFDAQEEQIGSVEWFLSNYSSGKRACIDNARAGLERSVSFAPNVDVKVFYDDAEGDSAA